MPLPHHKKGLQSFIGRINFVRRFLRTIATLLKPLIMMLKKNAVFNWTKEGKNNFQTIEEALATTPTLVNPNFRKDFILYAYCSHDVIYAIVVKQNSKGFEQPIAFFKKGLEDYEQRYSFVEKHVLAFIKGLKKVRHMFHSKVHIMLAHPTVRVFLLSRDLNEKRAGWITKVMEYEMDIQITKLLRGKGLSEQSTDVTVTEDKEIAETTLVIHGAATNDQPPSWLKEITRFLQTKECPPNLDRAERRYFKLQSVPYVLIDNILFRKDYNDLLLRCMDNDHFDKILFEFHDGPPRGHYSRKTTTFKVVRAGYYCSSLFKDAHAWVGKCVKCAMFAKKERLLALLLQPIQVQHFMKLGIDFIGAINTPTG